MKNIAAQIGFIRLNDDSWPWFTFWGQPVYQSINQS